MRFNILKFFLNKIRKEKNELDFKCDKCQFVAKTNFILYEHIKEKHRIFECDQCKFTSSSEVMLNIHKTKSLQIGSQEAHGGIF